MRHFRKSTKFFAEAWAVPDARFNVGEPLRLQMRVSSPAYMNVFHISTSCKVTRLVHNRRMVETQIVDFPSKDSGIEIVIKPPAGDEAFYFVATRKKISVLAEADILTGQEIASLDLTADQFLVRLKTGERSDESRRLEYRDSPRHPSSNTEAPGFRVR